MSNREISIYASFNYDIPFEEQIPMIAAAGFSHVSLGRKESHSGYAIVGGRQRIKDLTNDYGLKIDTIHGPQLDMQYSMEEILNACEAAKDLNVPVIVLHASAFEISESELPKNLDRLLQQCDQLENLSKQSGVKFALENLFPGATTELVNEAILNINSPNIGFCYDSSHDQIDGPRPFGLLDSLKDHLIAVHISDRVKEFVDHVIPWEGFIDWEGLSLALKATHFTAPLLLEVMVTNSKIKEARGFLKLAYERGCKLYDMLYQ